MRMPIAALILALLGACSEKNAIAERVEERADKRADAMEEASRSMTNALQQNGAEQQAQTVREAGEERAEAIRESDLKAKDLSEAEKKRLIRGGDGTGAKASR